MSHEQSGHADIDGMLAKILVGEVNSLPMLPFALTELLRMQTDDERYFDKVRELAENDPTFAVRLINLANAAVSSPVNEITTLRHAIARIGVDQIRRLVTTSAVAQIFVPNYPEERAVWQHSLRVAITAQVIAEMAPDSGVPPEQAYLCGLLHDIGRFILLKKHAEGRIRHDEKDWDSPVALVAAESAECGINHVQLGKAACEKWGLPPTITAVVGHHHCYQYDEETVAEKQRSRMVRIVQMADFFSMTLMNHPEMTAMDDAQFTAELAPRCVYPGWQAPPVDPLRLRARAGEIESRSGAILRSMGLD